MGKVISNSEFGKDLSLLQTKSVLLFYLQEIER
jgi:hypothetical protein